MAKKIHFQDNLFQLARLLDALDEGLLLDLDQRFFAHHYIDSLKFVDSILSEIGDILIDNPQFIERSQQLRNLYSVERKIVHLCNSIKNSNLYAGFETAVTSSIIADIEQRHSNVLQTLGAKVSESKEDESSQDVVSHEEMSQLLGF